MARGKVLFWKPNADQTSGGEGFGFIVPFEGPDCRAANLWFGGKAIKPLGGRIPRAGDVVEFEPGEFRHGKGPQAKSITRIFDTRGDNDREQITYVGGD